MLPERLLIGIDNGIEGGLVIFRPDRMAKPLGMYNMPVTQRLKKKEVDLDKLEKLLIQFAPADIVIEEPPHHAPSTAAVRSLALNFGKIAGVAHALRLPVHSADQKTWQREMLGKKIPKGTTKDVAAKKVREIAHPSVCFVSPKGKWLDGLVDAFLIAHWWKTFSENNG